MCVCVCECVYTWPGVRAGRGARVSASVLPETVKHSPCNRPLLKRYLSTAGVPPTRCRSSITYEPLHKGDRERERETERERGIRIPSTEEKEWACAKQYLFTDSHAHTLSLSLSLSYTHSLSLLKVRVPWLKVGQIRRLVTNALKIIEGDGHAGRTAHRNQVEHGIGRACGIPTHSP
jgi:hypothetical protein